MSSSNLSNTAKPRSHAPLDKLPALLPYRLTVSPYLNRVFGEAAAIGAVNRIKRQADGRGGYSDDSYGFLYLLRRARISVSGMKALVLGAGAASRMVVAALKQAGAAQVTVIPQQSAEREALLAQHCDAELLVNTSPVGMYPHCEESPVELERFPRLTGVIDLIYTPYRSRLLCAAEARGLRTANGLPLMVAQAKRACETFLGTELDDGVTEGIIAEASFAQQNIVLIGMPGCGKSATGQAIADLLGRDLIDTDALVERRAGQTIPQIFAQYGEEHFRRLEHQALLSAAAHSGCVIATGGGVVTRPENYLPLHANGAMVFIRRELSQLTTGDRPLSLLRGNEALYRERLPLYRQFADLSVEASDNAAATAEEIVEAIRAQGR